MDELEARKEALNTSILEEELKKPVLTREWIRFWLEKFRKGDVGSTEHQRQIIDTFVNSVYVFDDRVVLNFNFTDDSKTISREEVLGSSAVDNAPPKQPDSFESGLFVLVGGTELEQQRRRPPPAAETGSRGWDSVLIFQSPAKGLRKNQQTQPVQAPAVRFRQGSQRLGMSTGMTAVLWWAVQDENRNEQRQGITMVVVSCLLLFLIEYGILGSVQQICIWRIESCGMN